MKLQKLTILTAGRLSWNCGEVLMINDRKNVQRNVHQRS